MGNTADNGELPELTDPEINRCVAKRIVEKSFSAAACVASVGDRIFHRGVYGSASMPPPLRPIGHDALFDLASLTKPLGAGMAAYRLVSQGRADLSAPLSRVLPEFKDARFDTVTLDMLLDHTSGLPATVPFWAEMRRDDERRHPSQRILGTSKCVDEVKKRVASLPFAHRPGSAVLYSDVGFMVLGWVVERLVGKPLDLYLRTELFAHLGVSDDLFFVRHDDLKAARLLKKRVFVATAKCPVRGTVMHGQVHDYSAWAIGGVAGHAGLFGTADAVWRVANALRAAYHGDGHFFHIGALKRFWTRSRRVRETTFALGWDTPSVNNSAAGKRFSRAAVGHLGFTGTSLWIDLQSSVLGVVLCNAVHPEEAEAAEVLRQFRPRMYDLIASTGETVQATPKGKR